MSAVVGLKDLRLAVKAAKQPYTDFINALRTQSVAGKPLTVAQLIDLINNYNPVTDAMNNLALAIDALGMNAIYDSGYSGESAFVIDKNDVVWRFGERQANGLDFSITRNGAATTYIAKVLRLKDGLLWMQTADGTWTGPVT